MDGTFPITPAEMDAILGFVGERVADLPSTPGRNKVVWKTAANVNVVCEQHPYDAPALIWHINLHWHLSTPTAPHARYLPGDPFPNW